MCDPRKNLASFFSNFWHIFRHLPPLFVALSQKVSCATFQNYQISMYNSNTDSLGLILGVEVFFSIGHCSGALCGSMLALLTIWIQVFMQFQLNNTMQL